MVYPVNKFLLILIGLLLALPVGAAPLLADSFAGKSGGVLTAPSGAFTNGVYSAVSNAIPVTEFAIAASKTNFFTNNFGFDIMIGFTATTVTGVGLNGTNAGAASTFTLWSVSLTGGTVPLRAGGTASFTNGVTAGAASWTPFP